MTEVNVRDGFVDRRKMEDKNAELATPVLYWYDEEGKGNKRRRRTNGVAVTTDGMLVVGRATCSRKDQFEKSKGRLVVSSRIYGRAKKHCLVAIPILVSNDGTTRTPFAHQNFDVDKMAEACASVYREAFADDDLGAKRAYNAGRIFSHYQADIHARAEAMSNDFEAGSGS
jgi:hypothetical protein